MKGFVAPLLAAVLMVPGFGGPAVAEVVRPTLPAQAGSTHFLVHYDPATADSAYVSSALADFEESYSRLVSGGGGTPNAGLRPPVNDAPRGGDGRTDVYLTTPPGRDPAWVGGVQYSDGVTYPDPLVDSAFLFMTPTLARTAFRFRSAHEFMHVLQEAYITTGGLFNESTANWASDFALPDIEPGDSQFSTPSLPLDCSYGSWDGTECGNGYRQWLFFRWLSERYGDGFVHRLWTLHAASFPYLGTTPAIDRQILAKAIADESGDATLASVYADYAAAVWDPTAWTTTAVDSLHRKYGPPKALEAALSRDSPATGSQVVEVDHLATRYLRIMQGGASAAGDRVRVTVRPAAGTATPQLLSATGPGLSRSITTMTALGDGSYQAEVSLDAALVNDVVLPLTNNTTNDGLFFTYSAELVPSGSATPPVNDDRVNAMRINTGTTTVLDVAYAGGTATTDVPDCPTAQGSRGGVWFLVNPGVHGPLTIDPRASDFEAAVVMYDVTLDGRSDLWACPEREERGLVSQVGFAREYLIYVGRAATSGPGHTLRLRVDGLPVEDQTEPSEVQPQLTGLKITPKRFTAMTRGRAVTTDRRGRGGARLTFTLSMPSVVRFTVDRRSSGRMVGHRCVKVTRANRDRQKCTRFSRVTGLTVTGLPMGEALLKLTGRKNRTSALPAGRYRLRARAIDAQTESHSPFAMASFVVTRR